MCYFLNMYYNFTLYTYVVHILASSYFAMLMFHIHNYVHDAYTYTHICIYLLYFVYYCTLSVYVVRTLNNKHAFICVILFNYYI